VIVVGIDDTDTKDTRGTNAIARALLGRIGADRPGARILRHQLLVDPRVPYTSKNGSASILLPDADPGAIPALAAELRRSMLEWFIEGSDPGLCVARAAPAEVIDFARRCQRDFIDPGEARAIAARHGIHLEGLGGTEQGVIGALAAVGLAETGDDGRVVHLGGWPWPDDLHGAVDHATLHARGVDDVRALESGELVREGAVDIGKRLRPNLRGGRVVVFVEPGGEGSAPWRAVRLL
jgi:hypothetical protein